MSPAARNTIQTEDNIIMKYGRMGHRFDSGRFASDVVDPDVVDSDVVDSDVVDSDVVESDVVGSDVVGSDVVDSDGLFSYRFGSDRFISDGMPAFDVNDFLVFPTLISMSFDFQEFPCWSITWHRTDESEEAFSTLKFTHEAMVTEVQSPGFSSCKVFSVAIFSFSSNPILFHLIFKGSCSILESLV